MFAKQDLDYEVHNSFRNARDVLDFLAAQSPQAAHYAEILKLLSRAIKKRKRNTSSKDRGKYVKRILSLESSRSSSDQEDNATCDDFPSVGLAGSTIENPAESWSSYQPGFQEADGGVDLMYGWDSLDLGQWDNFPFSSPRILGPG